MRPIRLPLAALFFATLMPAVAADMPPNTLSAGEKKAGWKLLFDGKSLAHWRGVKEPVPPETGWGAFHFLNSP